MEDAATVWDRAGMTEEDRAAVIIAETDVLIAQLPESLANRNSASIVRGYLAIGAPIPWGRISRLMANMRQGVRQTRAGGRWRQLAGPRFPQPNDDAGALAIPDEAASKSDLVIGLPTDQVSVGAPANSG